jgi:iron complex transport system substrate-binding protein
MKINTKSNLIIFVCTILMLSSCIRHKDQFVRQDAEKKQKIERIITTAPSNTEIVVALGLGRKIIATDRYSSNIVGVNTNITLIDFFNPDVETVLSLEPDIIIANIINQQHSGSDSFKILEKLGIKIIFLPVSTSIESIINDVIFIADLLDADERGEEIAADMRREISFFRETSAMINDKYSVYFEIEPVPHAVSFGQDVFLDEMLTLIGAKNIFSDQTGFFVVNLEEVITRNPDVILTNVSEADSVAELSRRTGFTNINACKNKRIYFIDSNESARPSPNIIKALHKMAVSVYPEYYQRTD